MIYTRTENVPFTLQSQKETKKKEKESFKIVTSQTERTQSWSVPSNINRNEGVFWSLLIISLLL